MAYREPPASSAEVLGFLRDVAERREFGGLAGAPPPPADPAAFGLSGAPVLRGLALHGAQLFVEGYGSPQTPYTRLLMNWMTGAGKSAGAVALSTRFAAAARAREQGGTVFVVGFTHAVILAEMLRRPELGLVSAAEVVRIARLRRAAGPTPAGSSERRQLSGFLGILRRRLTDRSRGGFYRFFGYKEFAQRLLRRTQRGEAEGLDVARLFAAEGAPDAEGDAGPDAGADAFARVAAAERAGLLRVDREFLEALRGGLVIADEVHNVYNSRAANQYGAALQYALDAFPPAEAPRLLLLSATPVTGSAAEVVDLLNLLVPRHLLPDGRPLRRADFFAPGPEGALELRPGALERIALLAAGRVSFMRDPDAGSYPERLLDGEPLAYRGRELPYLRFVPCPAPPRQARALAAAGEPLAPGVQSLYDMVFPDPDGGEAGLYDSATTMARLASAPAGWRQAAGIVLPGERGRLPVAGELFAGARLAELSGKYPRVAADVVAALKAGPGKILLYHTRVHMTGVLALQEVLRGAGLAAADEPATAATRCAVCGRRRRRHAADAGHSFRAARFAAVHGEMDRGELQRTMERFEAPGNAEGLELRALVGSKVITEGLNFTAVRHELVASMPTDIATLVQVFGRVVRKGSHAMLPPAQRNVRIRLYVTVTEGGGPELRRYAEKLAEFLRVQEVERALRRAAADGFMRGGLARATLEGLPFEPALPPPAPGRGEQAATFLAHGFAQREVRAVAAMAEALLAERPVWTGAALREALRTPGLVRGAGLDPALLDPGNVDLALRALHRRAGPRRLVQAGEYLFFAPADDAGRPAPDYGCFLRPGAAAGGLPPARVAVGRYVGAARADHIFRVRLDEFRRRYAEEEEVAPALVEYDAEFHYALLRHLAEQAALPAAARDEAAREAFAPGAAPLARLLACLLAYGVAVAGARRPVEGYETEAALQLYRDGAWEQRPLPRRPARSENDVVVGYAEKRRFKLRPPLQLQPRGTDARALERGAACETRPRAELAELARRLRAPGAGCRDLLLRLLRLELKARAGGRAPLRWFYLFNERLPQVAAGL